MADRIEIYQDSGKQYRWRLKAANGEIIATGESHGRLADARRAAKRVNPDAEIVVMPDDLYAPDDEPLVVVPDEPALPSDEPAGTE